MIFFSKTVGPPERDRDGGRQPENHRRAHATIFSSCAEATTLAGARWSVWGGFRGG